MRRDDAGGCSGGPGCADGVHVRAPITQHAGFSLWHHWPPRPVLVGRTPTTGRRGVGGRLLARLGDREGPAGAARSPAHAGSWGLARSARAEASLPVQCIDGTVASAFDFEPSESAELETVLNAGAVRLPRLATAAASVGGLFRLHFHSRGAISNLFVEPQPALPSHGDAEGVVVNVPE